MAVTLTDYLDRERQLLHDVDGDYYTDDQLTSWTNIARRRVVGDTGCNRQLQLGYLQADQETFTYGALTGVGVTDGGSGYSDSFAVTFSGGGGSGAAATATATSGVIQSITLTNFGTGYTSAPTPVLSAGGGSSGTATAGILNLNTLDVINVTIIWGTTRIVMGYMSFTQFNAYMRAWTNFQQRPAVFTTYGQSTLYLGSIPDQTYASEIDTVVIPDDLSSGSQTDTLIYPYTDSVPYYAASLAKEYQQQWEESEVFLQKYKQRVNQALQSIATRRIVSAYGN